MGKSGKKTKSDRINALRQQYDAFLDEDKKRKDRNEFILGRLEKIRLSTPTLVPVRHVMGNPQINKYNFVPQDQSDYERKIRFNNSSILRSRQCDASPYCITKDEEMMLQEVSKKYILIPRLRPLNENSVTFYEPPHDHNDTDWRNKYNILDELKKIEKEDSGVPKENSDLIYDNIGNAHEMNICESNPVEDMTNNNNRESIYNPQRNKEKLLPTALQTNRTEKVSSMDQNTDSKKLTELNRNVIPNSVKNIDFENEALPMPAQPIIQEEYISGSNKNNHEHYPLENIIQAKQRNEEINEETLALRQIQDVQLNESKEIYDDVSAKEDSHFVSINTHNITEVNEPVDEINTIDFRSSKVVNSNITGNINEVENINLPPEEHAVAPYPIESLKNQEPHPSILENDVISKKHPQQEYESANEGAIISDNVISSQISDFENEQKEMFYSEEDGYTQSIDTVENNLQNEAYTNEQYAYYNESQQDQPYYPEVNEHVESTEQYDPSYEQQYVGNYDENVNAQYENQQYGLDNYENHQEVANENYEQHQDQQDIIQEQPDVSTENYEQQPVNYEYQQSEYIEDHDQSHVDTNIYDPQASEQVNYDNQQYNEMGQIEHPVLPDQNIYESQQDYVNTEDETIQNLEQQLDSEEGYTETKTLQNEPATEVENVKQMESNIKAT